jgi:hypothetical protein
MNLKEQRKFTLLRNIDFDIRDICLGGLVILEQIFAASVSKMILRLE